MRRAIFRTGREQLLLGILLLVTALVYLRITGFGAISWDDPEMVFQNKAVREFNLRELFSEHYVGNYIPLTMLFHAIAWKLFGDAAGGHHAMSILIHLLNGWLIFLVTRMLFHTPFISLFTTAVFLLHPLQVESVAWIGELKNLVSTTFYFASVYYYILYATDHNRKKAYFLSLLFFIAGCLSKPSVVVLPLALVSLDLLISRGFRLRSLTDKIPFFALALFFGLLNLETQSEDQFINYSRLFPYYQRIGFAGLALLKYTQLFLVPAKLSVIYPYPAPTLSNLITGTLIVLALFAGVFTLLRKRRWESATLILFVLSNLVLVLQLVPFGEVLYADRYMYVPLAGFGWIGARLLLKIRVTRLLFVMLLAVLLSALTFRRTSVWKDALTLYEDINRKYPGQFIALNSAGVECMRMNADEKALAYFNEAVRVAPRNYKGSYNRGLLFLKTKQPQKAIESLNTSISLYDYSKSYTARASAYLMLGRLADAEKDARTAVTLDAGNARAWFVLGNSLSESNEPARALEAYNRSISLQDGEAEFYFRRGIAYGKLNDFNSALSDLQRSVGLNPGLFEAYYWMGVSHVNLRQDPCGDFRAAARHQYQPAIAAYNKYCK